MSRVPRSTPRAAGVRLWLSALLSACSLLAALPAAASAERWLGRAEPGFQHITTDNGLPNEIAIAVAEDGDGYLWVGTAGGLGRWNGYEFRVHRFEPGVPGALPDNLIQVLHGDRAGRLWVGTSAAGLARYEAAGQRFVTIGAGPRGLSHVSVRAIADDGNGGLWVGTDGGLDRVDAAGQVTHVPLGPEAAGPAGERVVALLLDRRNRLWAGTSTGLFRRDPGAQQFQAVPLPRPPGAGHEPTPHQPESLLEDIAGRIWVGTARAGAYVVEADGSGARIVRETSAPAGSAPLSSLRVMSLVEARPGEVWIGTLGHGIVVVDTASGRTRRLSHQASMAASLVDNAVRGLYRDRSGLVWAATYGGLSRLDPRAAAVLTITGARGDSGARTEFSTLLTAADGRLWMGTLNDGVEIVDPRGGPLRALRPDAARPDKALTPDAVTGLQQVDSRSVYVGTYRGLYHARADGSQLRRVTWPGRLPSAGVGPMLRDGTRLWVGGLTDGLWILDTASGQAHAAVADPMHALTDRRITALARSADGDIWIGTRNGLNRLQPASGQVQKLAHDALAAGFVTSLLVDSRQRLWVGTYGGGVHLLQGGGAVPTFQRITRADGLPDENINAMLEDERGQLWVSTEGGLAVIDPTTLKARALRRAEGVVFQSYWTNAATRTAEGELLFGASGGLTLVRPEPLQPWTHTPAVVASDIRIGGKRVTDLGAGQPLQIPAHANSLAVEYAALDYSAPERNRYEHRLLGYDADWQPADATRRLAAYANLPPGDYTLELRGSNRDGVFSQTALALPIHVLPAWHQTLWFRTLAAAAVLLLLYAVVHARTRVLRARRRELQRLVDERTAELQAMSKALEEKSRVLERASIIDPLTGLHNRRFLSEQIDSSLAGSGRRAHGAAQRPGPHVDTDTLFFLIDVDHFKRVNDELGHAAGDTVLVQLALRLQAAMRESDYVVRWGGEEFLAVARDTDRRRADELAERIRAGVADQPFRLDDGRAIHVTCSVGHACWPFLPAHPQAVDWLGVVNLADMGLLSAKRLGRNAWVGLHGADKARPEGLVARAQAAPLQALREGEIRISSSREQGAAAEALAPA